MSVDPAAESFRNVLNSHGHGFQYAVLQYISNLVADGRLNCRFEAAEVPVTVAGRETHIDFVLRSGSVFLIAECKRADPAIAHWCFARSSFSVRNRAELRVVLERIRVPQMDEPGPPTCDTFEESTGRLPYHIGLELRTKATGDGGPGRGAIDSAQAQALRGASGFVDLALRERLVVRGEMAIIVPAIFTTAQLSTTQTDLAGADIHTGELPELTLEERDWIWYQHNASASMLSGPAARPVAKDGTSLSSLILQKHMRSVAVVTPGAIHAFLRFVGDSLGDAF